MEQSKTCISKILHSSSFIKAIEEFIQNSNSDWSVATAYDEDMTIRVEVYDGNKTLEIKLCTDYDFLDYEIWKGDKSFGKVTNEDLVGSVLNLRQTDLSERFNTVIHAA